MNWKKALRALLNSILLIFFLGGAILFALLLALLSGAIPLYALWPLLAVGGAGLLALILTGSGYLGSTGKRRVKCGFLAVCVLAAAWGGWGAYREHLPTLDDRALLLREYQPFTEGTKAVTLDKPSTLRFDAFTARHLRLDGATALYPVYAGFVQAVYPEGDYPLSGTVACSNTVGAYQRLLDREVDIIFAAALSAEQLAAAERAGLTLHMTPIGREAFVFFVNSRNPVTELTVEEVRSIYSGEITSWRQVGGKSWPIRPFQRAENSGSQSALQRLMEDVPLLEPETEDRISAMDGIIRQVASYRNYKNAIGFSFRFYSTEMVSSNDIRLLALNGVAPTRETIRNGSYPISSAFYAITAAPAGYPPPQETNSDIAAFLEWMLSPQGQSIVEKTGYVALS